MLLICDSLEQLILNSYHAHGHHILLTYIFHNIHLKYN